MGQSEYDVEVAHRQHFGLPLGDPAVAGRRLALGTMAIAAGVIGDGLMPALGALVAMAAEGGGAATRNGVQHFDMRPVQPAPALFDEAGAAGANNVSHLDGWPVHLLARFTLPRTVAEDETGISSSGLATALQVLAGQMQIDGRVPDVGVTEQLLDGGEIGAGFQQVGGDSCGAGYADERAW